MFVPPLNHAGKAKSSRAQICLVWADLMAYGITQQVTEAASSRGWEGPCCHPPPVPELGPARPALPTTVSPLAPNPTPTPSEQLRGGQAAAPRVKSYEFMPTAPETSAGSATGITLLLLGALSCPSSQTPTVPAVGPKTLHQAGVRVESVGRRVGSCSPGCWKSCWVRVVGREEKAPGEAKGKRLTRGA